MAQAAAALAATDKGTIMAVEPTTHEPHAENFHAHARDYSGFIKLLKYGAIASFGIGFIVVFLIIA